MQDHINSKYISFLYMLNILSKQLQFTLPPSVSLSVSPSVRQSVSQSVCPFVR